MRREIVWRFPLTFDEAAAVRAHQALGIRMRRLLVALDDACAGARRMFQKAPKA